MITFPNAKINLGLNIKAKRPDNYHEIETLMVPIGWCDILEVVPAQGTDTTLTVYGNNIKCDPEENLVMKAYRKLAEHTIIPPVDIYLQKIIPDGAGLGGGSADASFMLKALNTLFELNLDNECLAEIASTLGADCPLFIYNRPMLATGTGTTLSKVDIQLPYYICLFKPEIYVSTKDAYSNVFPTPWNIPLAERISNGDLLNVVNDFESSVFPQHPELQMYKSMMEAEGACYASMSGSGSSIYGFFNTEKDARRVADILSTKGVTHVTTML